MGQDGNDVRQRVATTLLFLGEFARSMEPRSLAPPKVVTVMPNVVVCARGMGLIFDTRSALLKAVRAMPSREEYASNMEQPPKSVLLKDARTMLSTGEYASNTVQKSNSVKRKVVRIKPMTEWCVLDMGQRVGE